MGQSTVIAMAFTAIMFVAGVSLLLMTSVSSFDTLAGVITDQSQQNDIFLHERVEFGSWTLDDSNILRVNITNTGDTTMMLKDIKNADLLVSLNNGSETTRWVGFDPAQKGWLTAWDQRVKLTIDSNDIDSDLSEFPVLIYLSTSSGRNSDDVSFIFDELQNDANRRKIAVTTSDGVSQCYVEVEEWDDANEQAWLWVKVPSISSTTDTELYLYFDMDQSDNTGYVGDPSSNSAQNVWSSSYQGVWHLDESAGGANAIKDSTINMNNGTDYGGPTFNIDGRIDSAIEFDGLDDYLRIPNSGSLQFTGALTIEAWVKLETFGAGSDVDVVFRKGEGNPNDYQLAIHDQNPTLRLEEGDGDGLSGSTSLIGGQWYHVVATWNGTTRKVYLNGTQDASGSWIGSLVPDTRDIYIGGRAGTDLSDGFIDEVHAANISRSAAWIKASFESGRDDLVDFGSEELTSDQDGSSTDYWLINRVFFRDSEGDLMNPMELSDPVHGGWDPWETIEIFVNLVEVDPTFKYLTFITPNGVQAHSSLSVDLDYGRATITAGESTVTVNHDLGRIPVNIQLTAGGAINQEFWARDWTDTTFVIEVENNQPDDTVFFWQVR